MPIESLKTLIEQAPDFSEFKVEHFIHKDLLLRVKAELRKRGILIPLQFYISTEWFCEDQTTSIAIPFYLCHPDYSQKLAAAGLELEGYRPVEALRILRHEVGHAVDHAFQLRKSKTRQALFGLSSQPYPEVYLAKKDLNFIEHLGDYYAQSHPDEDWAETFACWLANSTHPALEPSIVLRKKLKLVDQLLQQAKQKKMKISGRPFLDPLFHQSQVKQTLEQLIERQKLRFTSRPRSQKSLGRLLSHQMKKKMEAGYQIYTM